MRVNTDAYKQHSQIAGRPPRALNPSGAVLQLNRRPRSRLKTSEINTRCRSPGSQWVLRSDTSGTHCGTDWNNEGASVNATYKENFIKVKRFIMIKAEQDSMVYPNEGEWWGHFADGDLKTVSHPPVEPAEACTTTSQPMPLITACIIPSAASE